MKSVVRSRPPAFVRKLSGVLFALILVSGTVFFVHDAQGAATVGIYQPKGGDVTELSELFTSSGFDVAVLDDEQLTELSTEKVDLLLIPPGARFPNAARLALSKFMANRGHLAVLEPKAFDYTQACHDPRLLSALSEGGTDYRLLAPNTPGRTVEWIPLPDDPRQTAVRVYTPHLGAGDILFDIPIQQRSADRSVICFSAKGDYYVDILYLRLVDLSGQQWIAFVEVDREWRTYAVSMSDFQPLNKDLAAQNAMVDPARVGRLYIGMARYAVWHERDGSFTLGPVYLGSRGDAEYARTSHSMKWRLQWNRFDAEFPEWVIDPFIDAQRLPDGLTVRVAPSNRLGLTAPVASDVLWEVPGPLKERGREPTELLEVLQARHDIQRIPLLQAVDASGKPVANVAEVRTVNSGLYRGSSQILFGLPNADYAVGTPAGEALIKAARYVLETPQIQRITVRTERRLISPLEITLDILLHNPLDEDVEGTLVIEAGAGLLSAERAVTLRAGVTQTLTLRIGTVPEEFPLLDFDWQVALRTDKGSDWVGDRVRAERTVIQAAKHMLKVQQEHEDGRMSHHFFADIYGARALLALGLYLDNPEVVARNADVLDGLTGEDFIAAALRFTDQVVARQREDGAFPMGYGEHRDIIYIADLGSIALGLVQMASWLDEPRASQYLEAVGRYFDLRETFYISEEKAERLLQEHSGDTRGIVKGSYGLGFLGSDYWTGASWPATRREERGPWWVLPVSMGFTGGMVLMDQGDKYYEVMMRDTMEYLNSRYSADGYFHAEGVFWLYYAQPDPEIRARLMRLIETTTLSTIMTPKAYDWFEVGGRASLRWLTPVYYRNFVKDTPDIRTSIVRALWEMGSDSLAFSIPEVTSRFPKTIYGPSIDAHRYAGYSALWIMELLQPGSTLLKGVPVPKMQ